MKELLQEMAMDPDFHGTFDYEEFKDRLTGNTKLTTQQKEYLDQRLRLLDAFMKDSIKKRKGGDQIVQDAGGPGNIFASKGMAFILFLHWSHPAFGILISLMRHV